MWGNLEFYFGLRGENLFFLSFRRVIAFIVGCVPCGYETVHGKNTVLFDCN